MQMDHLILARRPDLIVIKKKRRTCKIVHFAVPADRRIKLVYGISGMEGYLMLNPVY